jgi:hypothetical protein
MKTGTRRLLTSILLVAAIATAYAQESKITVLNPKGNPPPIPLVPMASRPASLDGKTVYFVDIKYEGGASLLRTMMGWFSKNMPAANLVFKRRPEPMSLRRCQLVERNKARPTRLFWRSGVGLCAPAVAMAVSIEKLGKPSVAIVTNRFVETARTRAKKAGCPMHASSSSHRFGKTPAQHEAMVAGKTSSGKLVMQEIVDALSKPLTEDDQKSGVVESKPVPRLIGPETPENLQRIFLASGWTDYLPIILPTEQKVSDMLKGTSHAPDEVVGKMAGGSFEPWELTVEKVAANAVMAGAKPDYFPVILAIASSGVSSLLLQTPGSGCRRQRTGSGRD